MSTISSDVLCYCFVFILYLQRKMVNTIPVHIFLVIRGNHDAIFGIKLVRFWYLLLNITIMCSVTDLTLSNISIHTTAVQLLLELLN